MRIVPERTLKFSQQKISNWKHLPKSCGSVISDTNSTDIPIEVDILVGSCESCGTSESNLRTHDLSRDSREGFQNSKSTHCIIISNMILSRK